MHKSLLVAVTMAFGLYGCAVKTELKITVDLYDEDPRVELPMTPRRARDMIANLQTLQAEATRDASLQLHLATEAVDIYASAWQFVGEDDSRVRTLQSKLDEHEEQINNNLSAYRETVAIAVARLRDYVKRYQQEYARQQAGCNEIEQVRDGIRTVEKRDLGDECIIRKMRNEMRQRETDALEKTVDAIASFQDVSTTSAPFTVDWIGLEYAMNSRYYITRLQGNKEKARLILGLGESIGARIRSLTSRLAASGRGLPVTATRSPHTPTTLIGSSLALANEFETLRNDLPETATSRAALAGLVMGTSRFIELIDRLQDSGDPIWRIVTADENEAHWSTQVIETGFYAEGNAGVVVVRDDPLRFRVQSARNNPTALIQGQLEISRSVAKAAISIAGAVSGLPTDALASSTSGTTQGAVSGNAADFNLRRAKVEAWQSQRETALTSLERYLRSLATNLAELEDSDEDGLASQTRRLQSVLAGHKPLLTIPTELAE